MLLHLSYSNSELISNGWLFKPHILATTGLCIILSYVAMIPIVSTILKLFGRMSFEVYLLHGVFTGYALDLAEINGWSKSVIGVAFLFISFFVAYYCQIINKKLYIHFKVK